MTAHLALPRPAPPAPATSADQPDQITTADLALAAAAYAIESSGGAGSPLAASVAHLARLIGPDGAAPSLSDASGVARRQEAPSARDEAGLWAGLALLLASPWSQRPQEEAALTLARRAAAAPYRATGDVVRFGEFVLGDGTHLGDSTEGTADLLRESALSGLVLHTAAVVRGDEELLSAARSALVCALARFRAPDGSRYAHAVTPGPLAQAGFGRDSEGEALLCLLCLRLRADEYADELLDSLERYAAARLAGGGQARGYAQGNAGSVPRLSVRATLLVAAAQREAGRFGLARATVTGLEPLRRPDGLLSGRAALTVAAEAVLDHQYLTPRPAVSPPDDGDGGVIDI